MRKIIHYLLVTIGICLGGYVAVGQIPTSGLIEHFTFDNTSLGLNGNSLLNGIGTMNYTEDRNGNAESAHNVSGSQYSFTEVPMPTFPTNNSSRTIAFWLKRNSRSTHSLINYTGGNTVLLRSFHMAIEDDILVIGKAAEFAAFTNFTSPFAYNAEWNHIALTFDGSTCRVYINSELKNTQAFSFPQMNADSRLQIGRSPGGVYYGDFRMDDLFIYDRALSELEIQKVYTGTTYDIGENGLVEHFALDNSSLGTNGAELTATTSSDDVGSFGSMNYIEDRNGNPASAHNISDAAYSFYKVDVPGFPKGNSSRTVAFWMKHNSNTTHSLLNFSGGALATFRSFYMAYDNGQLIVGRADAGMDFTDFSTDFPYNTDWNHIAVTFDGSVCKVYINNVLVNTQPFTFASTAEGSGLTIGRSPGGAYYGDFAIDDLRIYNRALNNLELNELYDDEVVTSLTAPELISGIRVYPNPASDVITIGDLTKGASLKIMDMTGRAVYAIDQTGDFEVLNIRNLDNGIYFILVDDNGHSINKKLVINR